MTLHSTDRCVRGLRRWALLAALGLAAGLAAACGGGDAPQAVAERPAPAERSAEPARPAAAEPADRAPVNDAAAALQAGRQRREQSDRAEAMQEDWSEAMQEACRRFAEENPDQAEAALDACESGGELATSSATAVVVLNPYATGPLSVSANGVGNYGPLPMRLGPQDYRCEISVTQHQTDEAAGGFSATFSGDGLPAQTVELEGPSWAGEATLPAGGEGLREIGLTVQSDAEDAEWRVACSQRSG